MKGHVQILVLSSAGHQKHVESLAKRAEGQLRPGDHVRIGDTGDVFVVLRVDQENQLADLLPEGSIGGVEVSIPLLLLRLFDKPGPAEDLPLPA